LQLLISEEIYTRFPNLDEGKMTLARAALVNGTNLADIFLALGISNEVLLSKGTANLPKERKLSIYAGVMEALIGAHYTQHGLQKTQQLVQLIFKFDELDWSKIIEKDNKTKLQEYLQQSDMELPDFEYDFDSVSEHYNVSAFFLGKNYLAKAKLKKDAEQNICLQLLEEVMSASQ
jgi:ribonuclease-3